MKVKDLIKELEKQDPEIEVEVQVEELGDRYFFDLAKVKEVFYSTRDNRYCLIDLSGDSLSKEEMKSVYEKDPFMMEEIMTDEEINMKITGNKEGIHPWDYEDEKRRSESE